MSKERLTGRANPMLVRDIMERTVICIRPTNTYADAVRLMSQYNISGLLVVDEAGALVGVVSEKDLFRILYPYEQSFYENPETYLDYESREAKLKEVQDKPVGVFMSRQLITVHPETPIMRAAATMLAHQVHRLPVMQDGRLVGLITRKKIFRAILGERC